MLQTSKSKYVQKVMAFSGNLKLMLANIILQHSYQKFMNDSLPIILFHSFFFHKSKDIINNELQTLQTSKSEYVH